MSLWLIWLIIAAALLIIEVLTQMVWTMCLAIGCICAIVAEIMGLPLPWQLIILALSTILSFIILVPHIKRWHDRAMARQGHKDRTGMEALLGRRATVTHRIEPGELGRVRIDGDSWQVRAPGINQPINRETTVVVTGYDSIILTVEPLKK